MRQAARPSVTPAMPAERRDAEAYRLRSDHCRSQREYASRAALMEAGEVPFLPAALQRALNQAAGRVLPSRHASK